MNSTTDTLFSDVRLGPQRPHLRGHSATQPSSNAELAAGGTLSEARFKHYITQDALYLIGFGRALTLAAAKAPNPDRVVQFAIEGAIVVERALHGSFFKQYGITPATFAETPLTPACHHYVSYLIATAYAEPSARAACFWIYAEVAAAAAAPRTARAWMSRPTSA